MSTAKSGIISLNFLIYQDEDSDRYVAHCLEWDIVAVEDNPTDAVQLLKELVDDAALVAMEDDTLEKLFTPAPRKYWRRLATAEPWPAPKRVKKRLIKAKSVRNVNYALASAQ